MAWLAVLGFLVQLYLTPLHSVMCHGVGDDDADAVAVTHHHAGTAEADSKSPAHHDDCPVCQILPIVAAALAGTPVPFVTPEAVPFRFDADRPTEILRAVALDLRPEPRAPPAQA